MKLGFHIRRSLINHSVLRTAHEKYMNFLPEVLCVVGADIPRKAQYHIPAITLNADSNRKESAGKHAHKSKCQKKEIGKKDKKAEVETKRP